jgi:mannose/fructose/N-acetylgalactosamine-specific phosphotransferase system component IIC
VTHSIPGPEANAEVGGDVGPDPVVGAGITLFGILMMGVSGAADAHYAFDLGVLTAVAGAGTFVVCVALSAFKQRQADAAQRDDDPPVDL